MPLIFNPATSDDLKNRSLDRRSQHVQNTANSIWNDDMYNQYLEELFANNDWLTEEQRDYLRNNPRLSSKMPAFEGNVWQNLFGGSTAERRYYADMKTSALDWTNDTLEGFRQEHVNSPVEQNKRLSAAGINPDLEPGMISPGSAAENDQASTSVPQMSDYHEINDISQLGINLIQTAFSVYSSFQGIQSLRLDNLAKSFGINDNLRNSAINIIKDGMSEFANGNLITAGTDWDKPKFVEYVSKYYLDRLNDLPYSKKERKMLAPVLQSIISGSGEGGTTDFTNLFQSITNGSFTDLYNSRGELAKSSGQLGVDKETVSALSFFGREIYKPLNDINIQVQKLLLDKDKAYLTAFNSNQVDANGNVIPGSSGPVLQAGSDKLGYQFQKDMFDIKTNITSAFEEINKKITGSKKLSEPWKLALQVASSSVQSLFMTQLSQGLHFSYGTSSSVGDKGVSQSTRWSF